MTDVGEILFNDIKLVDDSIDFMTKEEIEELIDEISKAIDKLSKLKSKAELIVTKKETEEMLAKEEVTEEYEEVEEKEEEIEEETEEKPRKLYLTMKEHMTVALYKRLPEVGIKNPTIEKEAKEIIAKYNLTEEDIEKIYESVYG